MLSKKMQKALIALREVFLETCATGDPEQIGEATFFIQVLPGDLLGRGAVPDVETAKAVLLHVQQLTTRYSDLSPEEFDAAVEFYKTGDLSAVLEDGTEMP
ncbi:hypothetical protein [Sulfobacillus harzensis]|uniref:Uncharacterized protein n=1 Tax=Sulfobacillus harzensis TaxID=2729629 RepID=A0A7Y0Q274_9FIRM|nr:hypothetical protein [Sulfobacillus harzensis]NMP22187.1 hypothetical protein [Sulfobacillus harzensis]